jgi:dTDP-L-rhamnose 4-epimerase
MNILVTGGAGFIGSWLVESLSSGGHSVHVLDNLSEQVHGSAPDLEVPWLDPRHAVRFFRGDVRDAENLNRALDGVEQVVHLAAETGTGQSMYRIDHYYDVNVQATARLLEAVAARRGQVSHVVLASSRSVYGEGAYMLEDRLVVPKARDAARLRAGLWEPVGEGGEPLTPIATPEDAPPSPASMYAATKLAIEQMGSVFSSAYELPVTALRFQNVYGERQSLRNPYTGILSIFSNRMRQNLPITIFEDGLETRDFVNVSDVVSAIRSALSLRPPGFQVLNIGSGRGTAVLEVATVLARELNSSSVLKVTGDYRVGDIRHCHADLSRADRVIGFKPQVSLPDGLRAFCSWLRKQPVLGDTSASAQAELAQRGLGSQR